jgi:hypothetical protein
MMDDHKRISRRQLIRGAVVGGAGLAAAAVVGCGDDDNPKPTASNPQTATPGPITTSPEPTLAAPRWDLLPQGDTVPPPRRDHSLVTDGQRLYLFGGRNSSPLGDFWVYDLASQRWSQVAAPGPPARFGHSAGYDVITSSIVIFGGQAGGFFNDVWAYTPTTGRWAQVSSSGGPSPRYGAASAVDPSGRLIVSHGFTDTGRFDDTWSEAGGTWGDLSPTDGERPIERCLTRGVVTPDGAFFLFGGQTDSDPFLGDTWRLDTVNPTPWTNISPGTSPAARNLFSMVWDDERPRALVFAGATEGGLVRDVWIFDVLASEWSELSTQGEAPSPRSGHDAIWLPGRRSMVVFGGRDAGGDRDDLWELAFHG